MVPGCLNAVGARISNNSLEEGIGQRGHVHKKTLNQDLQARQKSVTQLTRLHGDEQHKQTHSLRILQGAHLQQI